LRNADKDEQTAEQLFQQLQQDEQTLKQELQEVRKAIIEEAQLNQEEIQELKQNLSGDENIFKETKQYLEPLAQKEQQKMTPEGKSSYKPDDAKKAEKIIEDIGEIENEFGAVDKHLEKLLKVKKLEEQGEEDAANKLANMWEEVSGSA
jgi:hypothetical protein